MATEKQIAANRANAKRSTGPRTLAGKLKSSRNAYRHGLSSPPRLDTVMSAQTEVIVRALIHGEENEEKMRAAAEFAAAHLELLRFAQCAPAQWPRSTLLGLILRNCNAWQRWIVMSGMHIRGGDEPRLSYERGGATAAFCQNEPNSRLHRAAAARRDASGVCSSRL